MAGQHHRGPLPPAVGRADRRRGVRRAGYRLEGRVRRLNALGFDVAEIDVDAFPDGRTIRMRPKVVDVGHHTRRLMRLTGLDAEEHQARRLLNDMDTFRAKAAPAAPSRWRRTSGSSRYSSRPLIRSPPTCGANATPPSSSTSCSTTAGTSRSARTARSPPGTPPRATSTRSSPNSPMSSWATSNASSAAASSATSTTRRRVTSTTNPRRSPTIRGRTRPTTPTSRWWPGFRHQRPAREGRREEAGLTPPG